MTNYPYRLDSQFVALVWERLNHLCSKRVGESSTALSSLPSLEHFHNLVDVSFWASLDKNEGRPTNFSLKYVPPQQSEDSFTLGQSSSLTVENVTRLAPALQSSNAYLGVYSDGDKLAIWGFATTDSYGSLDPVLSIHAHDPGQVIISFSSLNTLITSRTKVFIDTGFLSRLNLWSRLSSIDVPPDMWVRPDGEVMAIIRAMYTHRHGGTLLIVRETEDWMQSIKTPIPYQASHPFKLAQNNLSTLHFAIAYPHGYHWTPPIEPSHDIYHSSDGSFDEFYSSGSEERLRQVLTRSLKVIGQLTAVDGAVVLTSKLSVLAFGAKIKPVDANKGPETLISVEPVEGSEPQTISLSDLGGTRHQSAAQFVFDQQESIAIVSSQDGSLTALFWDENTRSVVAVRRIELTFR